MKPRSLDEVQQHYHNLQRIKAELRASPKTTEMLIRMFTEYRINGRSPEFRQAVEELHLILGLPL